MTLLKKVQILENIIVSYICNENMCYIKLLLSSVLQSSFYLFMTQLLIWSNKPTSPHFSDSFIYSLSFVPGTAPTNTISVDTSALSFVLASVLLISYHVTPVTLS